MKEQDENILLWYCIYSFLSCLEHNADLCHVVSWQTEVLRILVQECQFYTHWMLDPYVIKYAVCLWTHLTWWLEVLSFIKKSLADNFARFESCDCLWTFSSITLTGALEFCLGVAVAFILGIISVSDTWSLTDKVTLVLWVVFTFLNFLLH